MIEERIRALLQQGQPGILFVFDELEDHFLETLQDLLLGLAKGCLIRDLEEVSQRLGPLSVQPPNREPDFVHGLNHLVDLLAQHQPGQVHHGRSPHPGSDITRTRGEVAQLRVESKIERLLQLAVHLVDGLEGRLQLQPRTDGLHPQVVFFVDENGKVVATVHDHGRTHPFGSVLAGNQVPLDQHLFFKSGQVVAAHRVGVHHLGQSLHASANTLQNGDTLHLLRPPRKRRAPQITGQTHAAAHNDLMMRTVPSEPVAGFAQNVANRHI